MNPHSFISEGFILARRNYGEADRILDVFSRDKGKISLIAKGVRRPSSRKRGHLEIFSKINFHSVNGKGIAVVTEVETVDNYKVIRRSIRKISLAYYFVEVINKIVREEEENKELYVFLSSFMERLKKEKGLKKLRRDFVVKVLKILGFWPEDKPLIFPDNKLEEVMEKNIYSKRVGKLISE